MRGKKASREVADEVVEDARAIEGIILLREVLIDCLRVGRLGR